MMNGRVRNLGLTLLGTGIITIFAAGGIAPAVAQDAKQCLADCSKYFSTERVASDCRNSNDGKPNMGHGNYDQCLKVLGADYKSRMATCKSRCK